MRRWLQRNRWPIIVAISAFVVAFGLFASRSKPVFVPKYQFSTGLVPVYAGANAVTHRPYQLSSDGLRFTAQSTEWAQFGMIPTNRAWEVTSGNEIVNMRPADDDWASIEFALGRAFFQLDHNQADYETSVKRRFAKQ